jgi:putative ABC transport system permease protein
MDDRIAASLGRPRLYAALFAAFAGGALAIAGVGLFGLLAYSVAQRTQEIGIRMALGAAGRHIIRLVLRQTVQTVAAGLAVGLAASVALGRMMRAFLYGVSTHDVVTLAVVAFVLAASAAMACLIPVRRAIAVDPLVALRTE